jgi:ferritin-like metal-binding protein YciE
MMRQDLKELYIDELKDIYNAETQLVKALPKMAQAANSDELRNGFEEHLEQTREHVRRLEQIFSELGEKPKGKKCKGMEGLVSEGAEIIGEDYEGELMDAALISAAQRVEHYEIAAYGTVRTFAEILGEEDAVELLKQTLGEEKETDQKLTRLAGEINVEAAGGSEETSKQESGNTRAKSRSAKA